MRILPLFLIIYLNLTAQFTPGRHTPDNLSHPTTYPELQSIIGAIEKSGNNVKTEIIGTSSGGRNLYAMYFSADTFGSDSSKIKVLLFAQQHGNEQAGKEGALLSAMELIKPEYQYLFDSLDLVIIPQMNPDGSEINQRRNGNDMDLNRNHLILTEPETMALHNLFDKHLFEVTMDVHEYSPYSETWINTGFIRNSDPTIGALTNICIPEKLRKFGMNELVPYYKKYLTTRGFSAFDYCPGGPPDTAYFRFSTFDVNDGRQSFGVEGTFSFIQEGKNGKDDFAENLSHRAEGQLTGMLCLLQFAFENKTKIKRMVSETRTKLISGNDLDSVPIQLVHTGNGSHLELPVLSLRTGKDSVIHVNDFRPVVKPVTSITKPKGYLIPKAADILVKWAERQGLKVTDYKKERNDIFEGYQIKDIGQIDFEGDIITDPVVEAINIKKVNLTDYLFVPTSQLKGNLIVYALEPKSMLGLVTYPQFSNLLKIGEMFPILRVINRKKQKNSK
ncbi:MAG: hypothetical protein FJY07_05050 [Bacteroidetes bacterium]|nr:hypothetical protein [Bacteroidota bacterium]